jgi:hypothetical protein
MGTTNNYIPEEESTFLEASVFAAGVDDLWTSDGTISLDTETYLDAEYGSLKLVPSANENYVRYNHYAATASTPSQYSITASFDNDDFVESFVWVRPTRNCSIFLKTVLSKVAFDSGTGVYLFIDPFEQIVGSEGSESVIIGGTDEAKWQPIRSIPVRVPSSGFYSIELQMRIVFDDYTNASVNIARPSAYPSLRFLDNLFLQGVTSYIPNVFFESDFADFSKNEPTLPFTRFLDVLTTTAGDINITANQFEYLDKASGGDPDDLTTLSQFVDPRVCDSNYLSYLAQFRGRPLLVTYQPSTEGVGWEVFALDSSVLTGIDPATSLPVGTHVLGTGAANSGALPEGVEAYARWQVETGYYGHNAGTLDAMVSAAQRALTGTKTVNYTVTQNQIAFTTSQAETFGTVVGDVGLSNPFVLSLIEPARPLGMVVTHTLSA